MARNIFEEKIRLGIQATGDAELKKVVDSFGDLGDVAEDEAGKARAAMEAFARAVDDAANVKSFAALRGELVKTEAGLEAARLKAAALFKTVSDGGAPSAALKKQQDAAAKAVNTVADAVQGQKLQLQGLRGTLSASGIDTRKLGTAQGELKARLAEARAELGNASQAVASYRANAVKAAADVPASNERIAQSYGGIGTALGKLRGLAAPVLAFLTLRSAAQGIKALADTAAQAENARRAFQNLYGGVEEGNRAFESLRGIAKSNGLVFADVTEDAKKLKAFGLDPLNGSYQALIDQNAAVGGSQQDLSGKVLALGQAWAKQKLQGEEILQLTERGVPVWDLLSKATGKSVLELQKLSESGKLGRDVIKALYEEIGRANAGAAAKGLSGLSGLLSQASARWTDFLNKVVDSGVSTYFKSQIDSLLGSTGNLDLVAKRVADGVIGALNAAKSLGQQLLVIAQPIANVTLALAKNAEIIALVAKGWLALKLAQYAMGFVSATTAVQGNTAALVAQQGALAATGRSAGGLAGILSKLPTALTLSIQTVGIGIAIESISRLVAARNELVAAQESAKRSEADVATMMRKNAAVGRELQKVYSDYAGTVVQSADKVAEKTIGQAALYQQSLEKAKEYYRGVVKEAVNTGAGVDASVTGAIQRINGALEGVQRHIAGLQAIAASGNAPAEFAAAAGRKFDELVVKTKSAEKAVSGVFNGLKFTDPDDVVKISAIFDAIRKKGGAAADAIQGELAKAVAGVADKDLPKLKGAMEFAFDAGSAGAKALKAAVDSVNLTRLGVDVTAIKTGFTDVGRTAVDMFKGAVKEIDSLGLTAAQRSTAIAQAFDNAFKQASTKSELQALKVALQDALSAGNIGFKEYQERIGQVDTKLSELGDTAKELGTKASEGAAQAGAALGSIEGAAGGAAKETGKLAGEIDDASKFMGEASKEGQLFALANYAVSESAAAAYVSLNKFAGSGRLWRDQINGLTKAINDQGKALNEQIQQLHEANGEFDEFAERRKQLAAQYDKLGSADIERLLQAEQQLEQNRSAAAAKRAQQQEEELRRAEAISAAASAGAGASGSTAAGNRAVAGARRVVIRIETPAGDVELEGNEGDDVTAERLLRTLGQARSVSTRRRR